MTSQTIGTVHSGKTQLAGVIGWPVAHSQSPRLHGYWLAQHDIDGAYIPLPVQPGTLPDALRGLVALGFRGANVTLPHKEAVLKLVDQVCPVAERIGAVNTLVVQDDGRIYGENTDAEGFLLNLRQSAPLWSSEAPALVVGAGGAARAVCAALLQAGVPEVHILNRTPEKADWLANHLRGFAAGKVMGHALDSDLWRGLAATAGLAVNTTSLGMAGHPPLTLDVSALAEDTVVADIVYTPLETPFLAAARQVNRTTVDGLGMLLFQARAGFRHWFGVTPEVTADLRTFVLQGLGA